jgi:hypothetical protein
MIEKLRVYFISERCHLGSRRTTPVQQRDPLLTLCNTRSDIDALDIRFPQKQNTCNIRPWSVLFNRCVPILTLRLSLIPRRLLSLEVVLIPTPCGPITLGPTSLTVQIACPEYTRTSPCFENFRVAATAKLNLHSYSWGSRCYTDVYMIVSDNNKYTAVSMNYPVTITKCRKAPPVCKCHRRVPMWSNNRKSLSGGFIWAATQLAKGLVWEKCCCIIRQRWTSPKTTMDVATMTTVSHDSAHVAAGPCGLVKARGVHWWECIDNRVLKTAGKCTNSTHSSRDHTLARSDVRLELAVSMTPMWLHIHTMVEYENQKFEIWKKLKKLKFTVWKWYRCGTGYYKKLNTEMNSAEIPGLLVLCRYLQVATNFLVKLQK